MHLSTLTQQFQDSHGCSKSQPDPNGPGTAYYLYNTARNNKERYKKETVVTTEVRGFESATAGGSLSTPLQTEDDQWSADDHI
ncbi:hypothetical protein PoB_002741500 [Plakobranchus ocellatus]|uniref:Uncharacterized protein n=1 Tax=Plakobranchus ocellatus TaxID=259542 RepID=A0AAV3ZYH0_9GAST|nr:hypothetical protein PoB_002741500 [Plakobranchus ocellatus]